MTREEVKEFLPIMQAFAEGKTVQVKRETSKNALTENWIDAQNIDWDREASCYRIKPQPTYRPFKDAEECWNEMQKHQPFGWVQNDVIISPIIGIQNNSIWLPIRDNVSYEKMLKGFTFADGEPFGVKEEEQ